MLHAKEKIRVQLSMLEKISCQVLRISYVIFLIVYWEE